MRKILCVLMIGAGCLLLFSGCKKPDPVSQEAFLLGSYVKIQVNDQSKATVLPQTFDRLETIHQQLDPDSQFSEIARINQAAGKEPVEVSDDSYHFLKEAQKYSLQYPGFDFTLGPVTKLWGIGTKSARKPSEKEITDALRLVNAEKVQFDDEKQTIFLPEEGMLLDVGAVAKGFAADEIADFLREKGVKSASLDFGGNLYVIGDHNGKPWQVGIQDPQDLNQLIGEVAVKDRSVVTSGVYQRYLEADGKQYHHLFDPKTGYPFEGDLASVTIISESSFEADALATAMFGYSGDTALRLLEKEGGVEAVLVLRDGGVLETENIFSTNN